MRHLSWTLVLIATFLAYAPAQDHAKDAVPRTPAVLSRTAPSAEKIWADLMDGNQRFVTGKVKVREFLHTRQKLVTGQHPKVVVLTCSDSRVPPELLFDKNLGDLFVVRSAGNVADAIGVGSVEYAVEHLGSSVLVILGHDKCGAVTAACSGEKMPSANLQAIMDKLDPAVSQAKTYSSGDSVVSAAIEENVHQSGKDVLAASEGLRRALREGKLTIFEAMYKLDSGEVVRLGKLTVIAPAYKLDVGDVVRTE